MATKILRLRTLTKLDNLSVRCNSSSGQVIYNQSKQQNQNSPAGASQPSADVPGLSKSVVDYKGEPVGPGASKQSEKYKNPEYFCYHVDSYTEAEVELVKYRLPQPTNHPQASQ